MSAPREFAIAKEMQRLREENADLKARLRDAEATLAGRQHLTVIEQSGHVGQAAKILACLVQNAGRTVGHDQLMAAAGINGLVAEKHLHQLICRIRKRLKAVYPLPCIIGAFGVGYKIDPVAAAWLKQEKNSGGDDVSRAS